MSGTRRVQRGRSALALGGAVLLVVLLGLSVLAAGDAPGAAEGEVPAAARASVPGSSPSSPGPGSPAATPDLHPEAFGATGDGRDDTAALQRALDALQPGQALSLPAGRTYRHGEVLVMRVPGSRLGGRGRLLATREERSSLQVQADDVAVRDVTLAVASSRRRWTGLPQHRLVLGRHAGITVSGVRVTGSAGAGVYVDGASGFRLDDLRVSGTRADGIHLTGGASDGLVRRPVVSRSGDDGVAVVSYADDPATTRRVRVESPVVRTTTWGRGISVVGGQDVVFTDVRVSGTSAAGIYVATEGAPFFTRSTTRVVVRGARVDDANTDARVDHGAVLVSAGRAGTEVSDVALSDVTVRGTRAGASRQVGVLAGPGDVADVRLSSFDVRGGGQAFAATAPDDGYRVARLVVDGQQQEVGTRRAAGPP